MTTEQIKAEQTQEHTMKSLPQSKALSEEIKEFIPGGVNSPFRSFHEVGGHTIFIERGEGARIFDVDGNEYIDYVGAWGPAILGHGDAEIADAVKASLDKGPLFGAPHKLELELAKLMTDALPSLESVRFVNSGTEAVMSSIRLARGFTNRDKIVVFEGCYHGHSDSTLANDKIKHSSGIPDSFAKMSIQATFNDLASVEDCLEKHHGEVAAVILEPVTGSMGVIEPEEDFLKGLRSLCTKYDVLLIFDEVLSGFRVAYGGAQLLYGVDPDITCFGKLVGGGMPIGAYGARKEIMDSLMPIGKVYQAGTFSGNPLTMAGGTAMMKRLKDKTVYEILEARTARLFDALEETLNSLEKQTGSRSPVQLQRVGSMFCILFTDSPVKDYASSKKVDEQMYARFFHLCLNQGVYFPPTAVDASCVSLAHSEELIDKSAKVISEAFRTLFASAES